MLIECSIVALVSIATCAPAGRPMLAEVLYDPSGSDTGYEFVELVNPTSADIALAGLRIEAGDGAGPDRWTLRWTGGAGDTIRAGARFVIGGASVVPAPDAIVTLALQNGPDAVRLVWPDSAIEVLGYGEVEFGEYACGAPAADVPSGMSLARIPDDAATGSNALDFRPASPTPGRANQPGRDALIEPGSMAIEPPQPAPGDFATLSFRVRNAGRAEIAPDSILLSAEAQGVPPVAAALPAAVGAGETADATLAFGPLPSGKLVIEARVTLAGDESPANDSDTLRVRVGPGPLAVSEIQYHPGAGEGEWIELRNGASLPLEPAPFRIADRSGTTGAPREGSGTIAPDSLVVFAQHRADLLARFPALDPARVWEVAPWPALNNSNDATGTADEVRVVEPDGTLSDRVAYSATGVPAGVPIELRGGAWWPSLASAGTPLAPPVDPPMLRGAFAITPRRLATAGAPARIAWALPWTSGYATLELFDLAGRRVARPFIEMAVPARGERALDTSSLAPGVYVAAFRARPATTGGEPLVASQPLRIVGAVP